MVNGTVTIFVLGLQIYTKLNKNSDSFLMTILTSSLEGSVTSKNTIDISIFLEAQFLHSL